jgi:radical SAM protein with 4Fe4S-binding SPASM domain
MKTRILRFVLPLLSKTNLLIKYGILPFGLGKVYIETSSVCNRRCKFCPNYKYPREPALMEEWIFKKIIDELAEINFHGVLAPHLFNEPLLDSRLENFVKYARKKLPEVRIKIFTNGDFLTIKKFRKLLKAGVDEFSVTQYDEEMSDVMKNLFSSITSKERKKMKYRLLNEENHLLNIGGTVSVKKSIYKIVCNTHFLMINHKGDVVLCGCDYFGSVVFGNAKKENVLSIWNKPHYKKIRDELAKGIFNLEICKKCVGLIK